MSLLFVGDLILFGLLLGPNLGVDLQFFSLAFSAIPSSF